MTRASTERGPIGRENKPPLARGHVAVVASTERGPIGRENVTSLIEVSAQITGASTERGPIGRENESCRLGADTGADSFNGARPDRPREQGMYLCA